MSRPDFGQGQDAAIGDGQRPPVGQEGDVVRADAVRWQLADPAVAVGGVVEAQHTLPAGDVVLGRDQDAAGRLEHAVAVEVPVGRGVEAAMHQPRGRLEHRGEGAGPAGEHDRLRRAGPQADAVPARRQGGTGHGLGLTVHHRDARTRRRMDPADHEQWPRLRPGSAGTQRQAGSGPTDGAHHGGTAGKHGGWAHLSLHRAH